MRGSSLPKLAAIRLAKYVIPSILCLLPVSGAEVTQGRFTYQIPIRIPRGAHGMQPSLALTYDSGKGNDMVGVGSLLSKIDQ